MKKSQLAVMRLLCTVVIATACIGLLVAGAFAYNTAITRTPVETLTYGTFSAALDGDGLATAEDGSYTLAPRETPYTLTLRTSGNIARCVLLEIAAEEPGQTQLYCAAPDAQETTFTVDTDYALTLRLTVQETAPEETAALTADTAAAFKRPPEPTVQPTESAQPTAAAEQPAPEEITLPTEVPAPTQTTDDAPADNAAQPEPVESPAPTPTSTPAPEESPEPVQDTEVSEAASGEEEASAQELDAVPETETAPEPEPPADSDPAANPAE